MKHLIFLIFCFFILAMSQRVQASAELDTIAHLQKRAYEYSQFRDDIAMADSLSIESIQLAVSLLDHNLVYDALMAYFHREKYSNPSPKSDSYINKAINLEVHLDDSNKKFKLWITLAYALVDNGKRKQGMVFSQKAFSYAASTENKDYKILAYLAVAHASLKNNQITDAFANLLNAERFLTRKYADSDNLYYRYLEQCVQFNVRTKKFQKAIDIKKEQIGIIVSQVEMDSTQYMWAQYHLCGLAIKQNPSIRIYDKINELKDFCIRTKNHTLKNNVHALFRSYLINNGEWSKFYEYFGAGYKNKNPNNFDLRTKSEICLSKAIICEYENDYQNAKLFSEASIEAAMQSGNVFRLANRHWRYAQLLLRNAEVVEAQKQLELALKYAVQKDYSKFIIEISAALEALTAESGQFAEAYRYGNIRHETSRKIEQQHSNERLMLMNLDNQKRINDEVVQIQNVEEKRKFNMQYLAIGVGLIMLLLTLIIVSSLAVPNWLIEMLGFFSILFIFEFIILILDQNIHHWAHGEPIKIFLVKIIILSVLFPLHHVVEHGVTTYMVKHQLVKRPKPSMFKKFAVKLYPWLKHHDYIKPHNNLSIDKNTV